MDFRTVFSRTALTVVILLAILGGLGVWSARRLSASRATATMLTHQVKRGTFIHEITESGSVESARNVDIASKVRSTTGSGVAILEIVPEGTVIRPEDCIPEDAFVPLEVIKQLEEYHRLHGIRLADYNTERDPRQRTDLPATPPPVPSESSPRPTPGATAGEPVAQASGVGGPASAGNGGLAGSSPAGTVPRGNGNSSVALAAQVLAPGRQWQQAELDRPWLIAADRCHPGTAATNGSSPATSARPGEILPDLKPPPRESDCFPSRIVRDKMVLVRLDSASLENQRVQQQITCENSRASVIQALSNYEAALIALQRIPGRDLPTTGSRTCSTKS